MSTGKYLLAILAVSTALSAGAQQPAGSATAAVPPMEPSKTIELVMSNDDKSFMNSAASANQYEIQASQLALQNATNPALKSFAQHMIDDHTQAGAELTALAAKKNVTLPTALGTMDQSMLDSLSKKDPGKKFDNAYRMQMRVTHKKAISLFDNEARNGKDPDVKAWAAETLPKLKMHGGMANALPKAT